MDIVLWDTGAGVDIVRHASMTGCQDAGDIPWTEGSGEASPCHDRLQHFQVGFLNIYLHTSMTFL